MISNEIAKQLHDRFTRGTSLSVEEQAQLEEWYVFQDRVEGEILESTTPKSTLTTLQSQIETALNQLTAATTRIQEIASENETLRQEITILRRQLSLQTPTFQSVV